MFGTTWFVLLSFIFFLNCLFSAASLSFLDGASTLAAQSQTFRSLLEGFWLLRLIGFSFFFNLFFPFLTFPATSVSGFAGFGCATLKLAAISQLVFQPVTHCWMLILHTLDPRNRSNALRVATASSLSRMMGCGPCASVDTLLCCLFGRNSDRSGLILFFSSRAQGYRHQTAFKVLWINTTKHDATGIKRRLLSIYNKTPETSVYWFASLSTTCHE